MNRKNILIILLILFSISILRGEYKSLYSFYNFSFGAKALSLSNSFTSISDDLSAVFLNPAGVASFRKSKIYLGYSYSNLSNNYDVDKKDYGSYESEFTSDLNIDIKNFDFLSISVPARLFNTRCGFALSYYRLLPYNYYGNFESKLVNTTSSIESEKIKRSVKGESGIDVIALTAGVELSQFFYFGATVQQFINTGIIKYGYSTENLDYSKTYTENIRGRSYIFGLLFIASEDVSIGFSYHTKFTENFNTEYEYVEDIEVNNKSNTAEAVLAFPARFSIGVSARLLPEWTVSYDFSKILWSKSTITDYHFSTSSVPYPVRDDFSFTQTDITNSILGTEVSIPVKKIILFLRGGLASRKQLFSGSDDTQVKLKSYSCGLGLNISNKIILDLGFLYEKGKWTEEAYFQTSSSSNDTVYSNLKRRVFKASITYNFY